MALLDWSDDNLMKIDVKQFSTTGHSRNINTLTSLDVHGVGSHFGAGKSSTSLPFKPINKYSFKKLENTLTIIAKKQTNHTSEAIGINQIYKIILNISDI